MRGKKSIPTPTEVPEDVVHAAWHEYVYPLSAVERPMTPGFERAMRVINEWLAGRDG